MTWLLMLGLLLASALLSAAETAVLSLQPGERRRIAGQHRAVAALLRKPTALLVTLLLANLLANVGYFTAGARHGLALQADGRPLAAAALGVGSVLALVLLGEIVPKTLALLGPERLVWALAPALLVLRVALRPLVLVGETTTRLAESALLKGRPEPPASADDFKSAVSWRAAYGTYHAVEVALLHDVIAFGERRARDLMVPRVDLEFLDVREPREAWVATMAAHSHGEYPVCDGSPDRLLGTVHATAVLTQPVWDPRALLEAPLLAPQSVSAERLVVRLRDEQRRLAILLDEHGGVVGAVGLKALSVAVLGEIEGQPSPRHALLRPRPDTLIVPGDYPLHRLAGEENIRLPARRARTVAGAVAEALGRLPRRGDELRLDDWRVRVAAMSGRRVDAVIVRASFRRGA
jgi:putative hemolysin